MDSYTGFDSVAAKQHMLNHYDRIRSDPAYADVPLWIAFEANGDWGRSTEGCNILRSKIANTEFATHDPNGLGRWGVTVTPHSTRFGAAKMQQILANNSVYFGEPFITQVDPTKIKQDFLDQMAQYKEIRDVAKDQSKSRALRVSSHFSGKTSSGLKDDLMVAFIQGHYRACINEEEEDLLNQRHIRRFAAKHHFGQGPMDNYGSNWISDHSAVPLHQAIVPNSYKYRHHYYA